MRIEHVGLMAEDTKKLADWYCTALNMKVVFTAEGENAPVFIADDRGAVLEFFPPQPQFEYPESQERKVTHIAIEVDDLESAAAQIQSAGGRLADETLSLFGGAKARFFEDPEGHWLHMIWRPEKLW